MQLNNTRKIKRWKKFVNAEAQSWHFLITKCGCRVMRWCVNYDDVELIAMLGDLYAWRRYFWVSDYWKRSYHLKDYKRQGCSCLKSKQGLLAMFVRTRFYLCLARQLEVHTWKELFKQEGKCGCSYLEIWLNIVKIEDMIMKN